MHSLYWLCGKFGIDYVVCLTCSIPVKVQIYFVRSPFLSETNNTLFASCHRVYISIFHLYTIYCLVTNFKLGSRMLNNNLLITDLEFTAAFYIIVLNSHSNAFIYWCLMTQCYSSNWVPMLVVRLYLCRLCWCT